MQNVSKISHCVDVSKPKTTFQKTKQGRRGLVHCVQILLNDCVIPPNFVPFCFLPSSLVDRIATVSITSDPILFLLCSVSLVLDECILHSTTWSMKYARLRSEHEIICACDIARGARGCNG